MTTLLITPSEVLSIAFAADEYQREELIAPAKIETAQLQFLRPVLGPLYDSLAEERYAEFTREYIVPPLAYYVRSLVIDDRSAQIGAGGVMEARTAYADPASATRQARLRRQARRDADILLGKTLRHIEEHPDRFPEYDPKKNIRKRVLLKGGFILSSRAEP